MFSKILIPLDGTPECESAITPAKELASRFNSDIYLLEVTPGYGAVLGASIAEAFGAQGSVGAVVENAGAAEVAASAYLEAIRQRHGQPSWRTLTAEGGSADSIVEQARAVGADLIVMATHGRSGLSRLFIGSVADDVIRKCGIPVLVVHSAESESR